MGHGRCARRDKRASHGTGTLVVGLALLLGLAACKFNRHAEVSGVSVAQADGIMPAPDGVDVVVTPGLKLDALPEGKVVRLAIAREVLWSQVRDLRKELLAAGKLPVLLVARDRKVGAMELFDELEGEPINVYVSVGGKLCVSPPHTPEAKCVQPFDKRHVDASFTRELIREAVNGYGLHDVLVDVPADLEWADVVRSVDGARTAFLFDKQAAKVRVRLK